VQEWERLHEMLEAEFAELPPPDADARRDHDPGQRTNGATDKGAESRRAELLAVGPPAGAVARQQSAEQLAVAARFAFHVRSSYAARLGRRPSRPARLS
jgi:hypothetical protein